MSVSIGKSCNKYLVHTYLLNLAHAATYMYVYLHTYAANTTSTFATDAWSKIVFNILTITEDSSEDTPKKSSNQIMIRCWFILWFRHFNGTRINVFQLIFQFFLLYGFFNTRNRSPLNIIFVGLCHSEILTLHWLINRNIRQ